jgi:pilus assembly protein Flp/PilA
MITIGSLKSFFDDDRGATAIEYALIASLIAVALVVALTSLGTGLSSEFVEISGVLK